jgi:hypothetical protein
MQLKKNVTVFTADGEEAGSIDRVVLDPRTKEITDVVVRKGLLFPKDKVIPVEMIDSASENRVTLRKGVEDPDELLDFEETEYVSLEGEDDVQPIFPPDLAQPVYWYPYDQTGAPYSRRYGGRERKGQGNQRRRQACRERRARLFRPRNGSSHVFPGI